MNSAGNFLKLTIVLFLIAFSTETVTAQQRTKSGWEYCAITNSSGNTSASMQPDVMARGIASVCYFQSGGCKREDFRVEFSLAEFAKSFDPRENPAAIMYAASDRVAEMALAKAIAKLGSDGWEMVGQGDFRFNVDHTPQAIYFKRRK
jgi:hypothetical protein